MEDIAFQLLEEFNDMEALVRLTLKSMDCNYRIEKYIPRFKESFSKVLFEHLYTARKYHDMMELRHRYGFYLRSYLQQNNVTFLSWILDLEQKEYTSASQKLLNLSKSESKLDQAELSLAISKLAYLQNSNNGLDSQDGVFYEESRFDSHLDIIAAQNILFEQFSLSVNSTGNTQQSLEATVRLILEIFYSSTKERKMLHHIIEQSLVLLMSRKKVPFIILLDLWIYQKQQEDNQSVFVDAIEKAIEHQQELDTNFEPFLHKFWRNCILSDQY